MRELGELEKQHADFAERGVRIVAISNDDVPTAKATQEKFPNLTIVSDADMSIANAVQVVQEGAGPEGQAINAPTTFLVDGAGKVLWTYRADRFIERLSPTDLLGAIHLHLPIPGGSDR